MSTTTPEVGNTPAALALVECRVCDRNVPVSELVVDRSKRSGFKRVCRSCEADRSRSYYSENRERVLGRMSRRAAAARRCSGNEVRVCARCGERPSVSRRHHYCSDCRVAATDERLQRRGEMGFFRLALAREYDARRDAKRKAAGLTTARRGYSSRHQRRREAWVSRVEAGGVCCARCGLPLLPGQDWDLGHDDNDRSRYWGPEHRYSSDCPEGGNRATARHRMLKVPA